DLMHREDEFGHGGRLLARSRDGEDLGDRTWPSRDHTGAGLSGHSHQPPAGESVPRVPQRSSPRSL
ncbi:hypothetical protein ACFL5O_02990, partial [Myxococcota bacterium]